MGWLPWSSRSSSNSAQSDPIKKLDPDLKEFLDKESPSKYVPTAPPPPEPSPKSVQLAPPENPEKPQVPPESLFPDGRYAHIWKTYVPLAELEQRGKSDQEKMTDLVDSYNSRRAELGRAALENCAFEQLAINECFDSGSWWDVMQMCRHQTQTLDRCYSMQGKLLKSLGYMSIYGRSEEDTERIQMHADRLYRQMLERERLVLEARERGESEPQFEPIMTGQNFAKVMLGKPVDTGIPVEREDEEEKMTYLDLTGFKPEKKKEVMDRLKGKTGMERLIEEKSIQAELDIRKDLTEHVAELLEEERKARHERREKGVETVGDRIKRWWGWG